MRTWEQIRRACESGQHRFELHLFRHGETDLNRDDLFSGDDRAELTEIGRQQARRVGDQLEPPYDLAFASTLRRSLETLHIALRTVPISVEVRQDARLVERGLGELDAQPYRVIGPWEAGDFEWRAEGGGESYRDVARRCLDFLLDLPSGRVLACTHAGPMRIINGILREESDPVVVLRNKIANATLVKYKIDTLRFPAFL